MTSTSTERERYLDAALVATQAVGAGLGWKANDIVDAARQFDAYIQGESADPTAVKGGATTFAELAADNDYYDPQWRKNLLVVLLETVASSWLTLADDVEMRDADEAGRVWIEGMRGKAVFWASPGHVADSAHMDAAAFEIPAGRLASFVTHVNEADLTDGDLVAVLESVVADANNQIGADITNCFENLVTASGRPREKGDILFAWFDGWKAKEHSDSKGSWTFEGCRQFGAVLIPK